MVKLLFLGFDGMNYDTTKEFMEKNPDSFLSGLRGTLLKMTPEDELLRTGLFKSQYLSNEDEERINEKLRILGYIE